MGHSDEMLLVFVLIVVVACFSIPGGCSVGKQAIRAEAIERGHGEYVTDKHGNSTFRWKQQKASEE